MPFLRRPSANDSPLRDAQYWILSGKLQPHHHQCYLPLYNKIYSFWKEQWQSIFEAVGSPQAWTADDFVRQDLLCAILSGDEILGLHFSTFFDLRHLYTRDHRYFSIFPEEALKVLRARGCEKVMTLEFFCVDPRRRREFRDLRVPETLMGLAFEIMKVAGRDVTVGPARRVVRVPELAGKFGAEMLASEVRRGNLVCDIMANYRSQMTAHPDPVVTRNIQSFWQARNDLSGWTLATQSASEPTEEARGQRKVA